MKTSVLMVGVALLSAFSVAQGSTVLDRGDGPCVRVTVQNDRVNESDVLQNCERNASRTVQLGAQNRARTVQAGRVNDNKVRQIHFDRDAYFPHRRSYR